ncbi:MAG: helicase-related protein [Nocardioidaceae bacterium]
MLQGTKSQKVQRLIEIVEEAEANGRRIIVFSHFREVLDQVARTLPGEVFGPLTGSVPAAARQTMIDQYSAAGHGAVLVSSNPGRRRRPQHTGSLRCELSANRSSSRPPSGRRSREPTEWDSLSRCKCTDSCQNKGLTKGSRRSSP